jgi:predicted ATPase/GAF domain-containing protein/predicted Ser/Thr protein kinase
MLIANGELIFEGTNSVVYFHEESEFKKPIVVKIMREDHPTPEQIQAFYNEYDITQNLHIEGVRKAFKKEQIDGKPAVIMEYVPGEALKDIYPAKYISTLDFLPIAIQICRILGDIHQNNITHKDINGKNIILGEDKKVSIIDFGISTKINVKNQNLGNPEKLEGTLPYISPEQTGRMNRVVDYRTDLYSLGVVFYETLTGRLPFQSTDALELVHAHLAQVPDAPNKVSPKIPQIVSDIILKLLNKNAEDRYQSAYGLQADLERCLNELENKGKIEAFELGLNDFSGKLQIPQKLYGREDETKLMLDAFYRTCEGATEFMLISGYSGVGKSALVHELHKPVTERKGYFIEGKFDQFQKNIPYSAWIQAFESFVNLLLTENSEQLHIWRNQILKAVGKNGRLLTEVIPDLELIIGEQPEVDELGPNEAQNRFNYVIQNFVNDISKKDHPLVIFIDDWQWADAASLNLLKTILINTSQDYLLILGAYRDNEVNASHPFMMTLDEIRQEEVLIQSLILSNLSVENVDQLIEDTLHLDYEGVHEFSELIYSKTQGNAFFVNQMLRSLYEENLLNFDFQTRVWAWQMDKIKSLNITDNVVDLMTKKVQKLPKRTQDTLKLASGIGNRFNLDMLKMIESHAFSDEAEPTQKRLEDALMEGLVIPLERDYKFAHDRIQQAVYSLITETDRKAIHLKIGKLLLENLSEEDKEVYTFDIVNQWNLGIDLVQSPEEKIFLAQLNLEAGKKARDAAAYKPAFAYLQIAIQLLPENRWEAYYDLSLELYSEALQAAFLKGNLEVAYAYIETVKENAREALEKMPAFETEMQYHIAQNNPQKAIDTGLAALELFQVSLAEEPPLIENIEGLIDLPIMRNPEIQAAMEIMDSVITPAWASSPELFKKLAYTMVHLALKYGNSASACVGYAFYGGILSANFGDLDRGYKFGKLAVTLLDRFNAKFFKAKVDNLFISMVMHWKEPARSTRKPFFDAIQVGLETGEIEFASYNVVEACHYDFLMGISLENLKLKFEKDYALVEQLHQEFHMNYLASWQQMIHNLIGDAENHIALTGKHFDAQTQLPLYVTENQLTLAFVTCQAQSILAYMFGDYPRAYQSVLEAEKYKDGVTGMLHLTTHNFYYSLILTALFPKVEFSQKQAFLAQLDLNQKDLKMWAFHNPANCQHKHDLIHAEIMRLSGQVVKAMDYYDLAIEEARKNKFLPEEAIANELAARFYLDLDKDKLAKPYLQDAHHKYQLWGAKRKLEDLERKYEKFLKNRSNPLFTAGNLKNTASTSTTSVFSLDVNTIIKASQTLSGEVILGNLLQKMLRIVIENAGAEKGLLLLPKDSAWFVEAESSVHHSEVQALLSIPIESVNGFSDNPKLSTEVVYYVLRTRETLVLSDATNQKKIIGAAYVEKVKPKSVLCMPILYQGQLLGIFYLENNLTTDAFTPGRLEVLEMLSTQIGISIQNAFLYENLEEKVRERTIEVIEQKEIIEKKNQDITSSINYAKRIQDASMPQIEKIKNILPQSFIFFRPRDIVSGDFYWCTKTDPIPIYEDSVENDEIVKKVKEHIPEKIIITAVDCTGHGVPGAFMSMTGINLLNEIVGLKEITSPDKILNELHKGVRGALKQAETENRDGMDMALCSIDLNAGLVEYAGAKNQLVYIQNGELFEIKADKLPIGGHQKEDERLFTKHTINLVDPIARATIPTYFYMFSDGYPDQFGEESGTKFMVKKLKALLLEIHQKPMEEQKTILEKTFLTWMGNTKQLDDVLVMGFKIG